MSRARDIAAYVATGVTASEFDALDGITVNATSMNSTVNQVTDGATDLNVDTNTLVVDKSENRVGIGTAAPTEALDVQGKIKQKSAFRYTLNQSLVLGY